jgi:YgiT-type zinc finger domain-containing protein
MAIMNNKLTPAVQSFLSSGPKHLLIGGQWSESVSGETFATINPASGEVLGRIAAANKQDVDRAVAAARKAFEGGSWPKITPAERSRLLWTIADRIEERAEGIFYNMGQDCTAGSRVFVEQRIYEEVTQATVTLERENTIVVFRSVPAEVCQNCGEAYLDAATTRHLLHIVEEAAQIGVQVDVRHYAAA